MGVGQRSGTPLVFLVAVWWFQAEAQTNGDLSGSVQRPPANAIELEGQPTSETNITETSREATQGGTEASNTSEAKVTAVAAANAATLEEPEEPQNDPDVVDAAAAVVPEGRVAGEVDNEENEASGEDTNEETPEAKVDKNGHETLAEDSGKGAPEAIDIVVDDAPKLQEALLGERETMGAQTAFIVANAVKEPPPSAPRRHLFALIGTGITMAGVAMVASALIALAKRHRQEGSFTRDMDIGTSAVELHASEVGSSSSRSLGKVAREKPRPSRKENEGSKREAAKTKIKDKMEAARSKFKEMREAKTALRRSDTDASSDANTTRSESDRAVV